MVRWSKNYFEARSRIGYADRMIHDLRETKEIVIVLGMVFSMSPVYFLTICTIADDALSTIFQ